MFCRAEKWSDRSRMLVGHDRFVGEHAYRQLAELYRALRLYMNCFQPSMKLLSKHREGKKVRCLYDESENAIATVSAFRNPFGRETT